MDLGGGGIDAMRARERCGMGGREFFPRNGAARVNISSGRGDKQNFRGTKADKKSFRCGLTPRN